VNRSKYQPEILIAMFRKAAKFRGEMVSAGFTDNGGAIHSAERILNILGQRIKYPKLSHANNLRHLEDAEFSIEARRLYNYGNRVLIEHVAPLRHLTRMAIEKIDAGVSDTQFVNFLRRHYRLVLLSPAETERLNRHNKSKVTLDRLEAAGIKMEKRKDVKSKPLG
jgi:hypothetical protein